jgi:hypothetical protein
MAKKPKNSPAAPNPDSQAQAPAPGPALSPEEIRRNHIEANAKDSLAARRNELDALLKGSIRGTDRLDALAAVGEAIMSVALHTRGRLRAASGRTDASLAAKGAFVKTATRKALKIADLFETELTAWNDFVEAVKPAVEACTRTVKDLDLPGMKAAIGAGGVALFDDEGAPSEKAVVPPPATPEPPPATPEPAPAPPALREILTLGMAAPGPVIDVNPEPAHPLEGMTEGEAEAVVQELLADLEEAGVEEGLKRKDWKAAWEAWMKIWPEDCKVCTTAHVWDLVMFALNVRKPISWAVPTDQEFFDYQRKLAIAAGE